MSEPTYRPPSYQEKPKRKWGRMVLLGALGLTAFVVLVSALSAGPSIPEPVGDPAPPAPPGAPVVQDPAFPTGMLTNGQYRVGTDVEPGQYRSAGPEKPKDQGGLCYYDQKDSSGTIIPGTQGVVNEGQALATLKEGTVFTSMGCQDWTRVD